ncbi:hypothetical protein RHS01_06330 [Rhizoctonia solani]|uniref:Uncharacterized protein n=1 Tax=Rhizoctonia solani TaxID=456999 RepID=A0A8H7M3P5_9AGAM|nr:hypothetical protein RHS01_06330 [Rhizoctonia solani]
MVSGGEGNSKGLKQYFCQGCFGEEFVGQGDGFLLRLGDKAAAKTYWWQGGPLFALVPVGVPENVPDGGSFAHFVGVRLAGASDSSTESGSARVAGTGVGWVF